MRVVLRRAKKLREQLQGQIARERKGSAQRELELAQVQCAEKGQSRRVLGYPARPVEPLRPAGVRAELQSTADEHGGVGREIVSPARRPVVVVHVRAGGERERA